jgi:hypothetical protein
LTEKPIARIRGSFAMIASALCAGCLRGGLDRNRVELAHGALLNYGDAVAHLHIARRVFDSHQPRFSQLGSVWLPLPHILLIPFVQVYSWWANGLAGVFPSALAYLAVPARHLSPGAPLAAAAAAALALAFFAINPNLLYLQTTAMTEPLFVCEMIWITVWLVEWRAGHSPKQSNRLLWLIACCWWPPSSPATTAGSWRCWRGPPSASRWPGAVNCGHAPSGWQALW